MTTTELTVGASADDRWQSRWLDTAFLVGLAGVFVVNAIVAVIDPSDFTGLVERSTVGRWLKLGGADWLAPTIAVNDLSP